MPVVLPRCDRQAYVHFMSLGQHVYSEFIEAPDFKVGSVLIPPSTRIWGAPLNSFNHLGDPWCIPMSGWLELNFLSKKLLLIANFIYPAVYVSKFLLC